MEKGERFVRIILPISNITFREAFIPGAHKKNEIEYQKVRWLVLAYDHARR